MKEKLLEHYRAISEIIGKDKAMTAGQLIKILQPKISGWSNVYRTVHSSEAFSKLDYMLWKRLFQWACRRHNKKGKRWVAEKYFGQVGTRRWVFMDKTTGAHIKAYSLHKVKTGSYARVGYDRSYYDGDTAYWADRLSKGYGGITPSKAKMLKKQDGKCPHCGDLFTNEDLLESHHEMYKSKGGADTYRNLVLLHRHCHDAVHKMDRNTAAKNNQFAVDDFDWKTVK
jgi:RNA-directed DNA polymerase